MTDSVLLQPPSLTPPLDPGFRPAVLGHRALARAVEAAGGGVPVVLAVERAGGEVAHFRTRLLPDDHPLARDNAVYLERVVKFLLWQKGGFRVYVQGPRALAEELRRTYSPEGARAFDADFMAQVYEQPRFEVVHVGPGELPAENESPAPIGGHLDGCRIGFDAGGSDRKVAAVIDGKEVFSTEVVWHPKTQSDPQYHIDGINHSIALAAQHLPRIDAIGVSSAGIYVNNRTMVASLFRKVPRHAFEEKIKTIYLDVAKKWGGVPLRVANDGDVTALAGAMNLGDCPVLGIAMGTSQAVGYVNRDGLITGWLNELAFAPVDYSPEGALDTEWSGDRGVGSQYFSQDAVIRLAPRAGIELDPGASPGEKLKHVQELLAAGDPRPRPIFETIGVYLGYALMHYAEFYPLKHVLLLGRVTSGEGGNLLLRQAERVLRELAPELAEKVTVHLPDEASRRVGQSIAAASLPRLA